MRARIEATIERLIATLDAFDGDPDLEAVNKNGGDILGQLDDEEPDAGDGADAEPSLGSIDIADQRGMGDLRR